MAFFVCLGFSSDGGTTGVMLGSEQRITTGWQDQSCVPSPSPFVPVLAYQASCANCRFRSVFSFLGALTIPFTLCLLCEKKGGGADGLWGLGGFPLTTSRAPGGVTLGTVEMAHQKKKAGFERL